MAESGADFMGVNSIFEAESLRESGINLPIYILGYISNTELEIAVDRGFHFVVYNKQTLTKLDEICRKLNKPAFTHLKLETGNFRQGIHDYEIPDVMKFYQNNDLLKLEGISTHFANIEDTTDHSYAIHQLKLFKELAGKIEDHGFSPHYKHCANSAATILFPNTYFDFVRPGIGLYGLWPSKETLVSAIQQGKQVDLKPVLTWKTKIAQVKDVPEGSYIGYGCTYKATQNTKMAILPVGYYDGYNRMLSNNGYVLINGKRAPIRGRVCMNISMVDVSHIPEAKVEDEVVLLGKQGEEEVNASQLATWLQTINYEVVTHINEKIRRKVV